MRDLRKWLFVCIGVVAVLAFVAVAITWIDADKPAPAAATDKSSMANPAVSEIAPSGYRLADIYASLNGVAATPTWTLVTASGNAPAACKTAIPVGAQDLGANATNWQDWEGRPLDLRTAGALTLAAPPDASVHSSLLVALGTDQATASDWAVIPLPDARRHQSGRMMVNLDSGARLLISSDDVAATYRSATLVIEVAAPDVSQADRLAQNCADAGLTGDVRWERPFLATITALTPNPWADWTGAASVPYPTPKPAANGHVDDARLLPGGNVAGTVLTWSGPDVYDASWLLPQGGGAAHQTLTGYTLVAANLDQTAGEFGQPVLDPPAADNTVWDFNFAAGDVLGAQVGDHLRITSADAQHSVNGRIAAIGQPGTGITRYTLSTVDLTTHGVPLPTGGGYAIETLRTALKSVNHNATMTGDGTAFAPLGLAAGAVTDAMLRAANSPADGFVLTYDASDGLTWTAPTTGTDQDQDQDQDQSRNQDLHISELAYAADTQYLTATLSDGNTVGISLADLVSASESSSAITAAKTEVLDDVAVAITIAEASILADARAAIAAAATARDAAIAAAETSILADATTALNEAIAAAETSILADANAAIAAAETSILADATTALNEVITVAETSILADADAAIAAAETSILADARAAIAAAETSILADAATARDEAIAAAETSILADANAAIAAAETSILADAATARDAAIAAAETSILADARAAIAAAETSILADARCCHRRC